MTRNVVLVVLDTVRKDYFDLYAHRLQEAADVTFEQCRAASSWSVPSHASIFTGELPSEHGCHAERFDANFSFADVQQRGTLLGDLPDHTTIGVSANAYINEAFGVDRLFDEFHDYSIGSHTSESLFPDGVTVQDYMREATAESAVRRYLGFLRACLTHERPAKSLANGLWAKVGHQYKTLPLPEFVDDGAATISATARERAAAVEEPFLLFANYMDAHTPLRTLVQYDDALHDVPNDWSSTHLDKWELNRQDAADEDYASNYRALYGAAIDYLDRQVTGLVERVQAVTDRETTFVVLSDHGHNLGYPADQGYYHHTGSMSEGVLHTPCVVVNAPDGYPETETRYLSHCQLRALVRGLANGEPFDESLVGGRAAAETIGLLGAGDGTWGRDFSEREYAYWNRMIRCLYDGDRKVEWDSRGESVEYRLDTDRPCWQGRVSGGVGRPADAADWFADPLDEYKRRAADETQDLEFDDAVADRLETLGYL